MKDINSVLTVDETMSSVIDKRSVYYTTILSHFISRDGNQMVCGIKSGKLCVFNINSIVKQNTDFDNNSFETQNIDSSDLIRRPQQIVSSGCPVLSLAPINDRLFVCGSKGQIQGWTSDPNGLNKEWTIELPSNDCLVNALVTTDQMIFGGCGDNLIKGFDVETHKQLICLNEHKDYVNCVILSEDNQTLYSGGEDGSVLVWDLRAPKKSVSSIRPHQTSELSRPNYGKWIGSLQLTSDEWLICGGGPHLSLWHLRSMSYASKFDTNSTTNVVKTHNESIISGGSNSDLHIWEMNGRLKSLIPLSINNVFSISTFQYKDSEFGVQQLITCAGMSYKIDVCMNCKYKDFELLVY